jgi:hypothetical protein
MIFFVILDLGKRMRRSQNGCGKKVAMLKTA